MNAVKKIVLYHAENHFSVITSLPAFYGKKYVCPRCLEGYAHPHIHRCKKDACVGCQAKTKCKKDESKRCSQCNRMFVSELCLQNHYKNGLCRYLKACKECGKTFHSFNEHKCGYVMCKVCNEKKPKDHKCYIRPLKNKNDAEEGKNLQYIFYDFESMLIDNIHVPMLCVAHKVCDDCITFPMNSKECECQRERKIFQGSNTLKEFGDWVWNGRKEKVIAMAHNAQAYDLHFIMQYVHDQGKKPSVILNKEKKILSMECENVKFIDSLNFLPMALAKLPKAFGLKELKKGFFPHLFNIPANQNYKGPIPDKMYYDPDGMMDDKRTEFLEWYNQQDHFDFQQDILAYCISDVDILQRCCGKFKELFIENTHGMNPFESSITIASACNRVYRTMFLEEDQIAIIPSHGYFPGNNSAIATCWMDYESKQKGFHIQHARNGGEVRVEGRLVDGLYGEKHVYQFHGCFWHGCPSCFPNRSTVNSVNQCTMNELYQKTELFTSHLKGKGYTVNEKWECEFKNELKKDPQLEKFYKQYEPYTPIKPRDAFFGGRTNAIRLFHESKEDEQIRYVDFTSLYPYVCKYAKLPVG